jgi:Rifampin ADP-ribosyl transferase
MKNEPMPPEAKGFGPFYHGTKADLQPGDLLEPGYSSIFGERRKANYIYLTATLDAATWAQNWRWAGDPAGSTAWNPRAPLRMTPT